MNNIHNHGFFSGEKCNRNKCKGIIQEHKRSGCSCHINPPCGSCTESRAYCAECGWEEKEDYQIALNDYVRKVDSKTNKFNSWEPRELDKTKIDWYSKSHTNSSMIKEGVYPEGTTREEVLEKVKGTFGGRFESYGNGKFKYIAYTD